MVTFAVSIQEMRKKMAKTIVIWRDNLKQASQAVKLVFHSITLSKKNKIHFSNQIGNNTSFKGFFIITSKVINIITKNMLKCSLFYHMSGLTFL